MITGRGNQRRRVEVLEANNPPKAQGKDDEAMPLIWEAVEAYPKALTELNELERVRGGLDDEDMSYIVEILDRHPEAKAAVIVRLKGGREGRRS